MPTHLTRMTLKEQAYHALREMIISHRFSAGRWINVEKLSKELGVSRTPVWQALKDLENEGLVTHLPNRGIRMAEMTPRMAVELYQVREGMEALAASLAAGQASESCLGKLKSCLDEQRPVVEAGDLVGYSRSDFDFHSILYDACGNKLLRELLDNIKYRSRPLVCDISPILSDLYQDHLELVEALEEGDADRAGQVMRTHNRRMRDWLRSFYGAALDAQPRGAELSGGSEKMAQG